MNTFSKAERLYKRSLIEKLFSNDSHSFFMSPLRVIYLPSSEIDVQASILISVSKKRFKHAVQRNRVKRMIREAYRTNKSLLNTSSRYLIAFVYQSDEIVPFSIVEECMKASLLKISMEETR